MTTSTTWHLLDAEALRRFIAERFRAAAADGCTAGELRVHLLKAVEAEANKALSAALSDMERDGAIIVTRRHKMGNRWTLPEHGTPAEKLAGAPKRKKVPKPAIYDRFDFAPVEEPEPPRRARPRVGVPRSGLNLAPDLAPVGGVSAGGRRAS